MAHVTGVYDTLRPVQVLFQLELIREVYKNKYTFNQHTRQADLGAGIVELSSLADLQTTRAEDEDFLVAVDGSGLVDGISFAEALVLASLVDELLEEEAGVLGTSGGLGVELNTGVAQKTNRSDGVSNLIKLQAYSKL